MSIICILSLAAIGAAVQEYAERFLAWLHRPAPEPVPENRRARQYTFN